MTAIEDELRHLYAELPGAREIEARVLAAFADRPGASAPGDTEWRRQPARRAALSWTAAGVSAATVAALAVGVVALVDRPTTTESTAGGSTSSAAAASPTPSSPAPMSARPAVPATVTVTPQVIAQTLISLLPAKGSTAHLSGSDSLGEAGAGLVYDDGHGAAQVTVLLQFPYRYQGKTLPQGSGPLCVSNPMPTQQCETRSDGSQLSTYQGDANIPGGATEWEVTVLRTDGVRVDVSEWNSPTEKGGPQTRPEPPFTMAELTAIADSRAWQPTVPADTARQDAHLFAPAHS